ncbi:MAG: hypothetical protein WAV54_03700 [Acidimicrobiales bacterium]
MPHAPGASTFAADARRQAAQILSRTPYTHRPARIPAPLAGALRALGRGFLWAFGPPIRWLWRQALVPFFSATHRLLGAGGWAVVLALALAFGMLVGLLLIRRRSRIATRPTVDELRTAGEDLTDLERAAEDAEVRGANELAVRLRFRLGFARLEAQGVIPDRRTTTSHQVGLVLQSRVFDELSSRHELIAYAQKPALAHDVASARDGWDQLLAETSTTERKRQDVRQAVGSVR